MLNHRIGGLCGKETLSERTNAILLSKEIVEDLHDLGMIQENDFFITVNTLKTIFELFLQTRDIEVEKILGIKEELESDAD